MRITIQRGWPSQCLPDLRRTIREITKLERIAFFKIGRTNNIDVRHGQYRSQYPVGPDRLHKLYKTSSIDHALEVEGKLIAWFQAHPKSVNESPHAGGNVAPDDHQYVYVAVWHRAKSPAKRTTAPSIPRRKPR